MRELSRETRIRRDRYGRWFDGDDPLDQPAIERAFDRWLDLAEDGRYCLRNSVNWAYVSIEGPPIFVRQAVSSNQGLELLLSDGRLERLDPATLELDQSGAIYCRVRGGKLRARFDHGAAMSLGECAGEDEAGPYVALAGARYRFSLASDSDH
jgi:hypothetical protein